MALTIMVYNAICLYFESILLFLLKHPNYFLLRYNHSFYFKLFKKFYVLDMCHLHPGVLLLSSRNRQKTLSFANSH